VTFDAPMPHGTEGDGIFRREAQVIESCGNSDELFAASACASEAADKRTASGSLFFEEGGLERASSAGYAPKLSAFGGPNAVWALTSTAISSWQDATGIR
jgi:hypothetical protein